MAAKLYDKILPVHPGSQIDYLDTGVKSIKKFSDKKKSAKNFEYFEGLKLGFPSEIQVSGLYRKVREGSSLISSNFH